MTTAWTELVNSKVKQPKHTDATIILLSQVNIKTTMHHVSAEAV